MQLQENSRYNRKTDSADSLGMTNKVNNIVYTLNCIYFYLTEGCNVACRHCWIAPKFQTGKTTYPTLDPDLFGSIIDQALPLGLSSVKLTGGEPLMHPEILNILKIVREKDLCLRVETNGILCTRELAREIAMCKNPSVSVSLDAASAEVHDWVRGVEGSFEAAKEGIKHLVSAGLKPQVIMSIINRNKDQVEAVVRLAESLGAGSVKFNIVMPTARGDAMHESGETTAIEELVALGLWVENTLSESTHLHLHYSHPPAFLPLGKIFGINGGGIRACGILGILGVIANGSYALCGIGETVPELVFGHAATRSLKEVWEEEPVLQELREGFTHRMKGVCGDCLMKEKCLGSCVAQNYYTEKDLWAPFWYCKEAREQGLFPESRLVDTAYETVTAI